MANFGCRVDRQWSGFFKQELAFLFVRGAQQGEVRLVVHGDDFGLREMRAVGGFEFEVGCVCDEFGSGEDALQAHDGGEGAALVRRVFFPRLAGVPGLQGGVDADDGGLEICAEWGDHFCGGGCLGGGFGFSRLAGGEDQ